MLFMALTMVTGSVLPVQAVYGTLPWPDLTSMGGAGGYSSLNSVSNKSNSYKTYDQTSFGALIQNISNEEAAAFQIESYEFKNSYKHPTVLDGIELGSTYDFTTPVCFWARETDIGRTHPYLLMAGEKTNLHSWTEEEQQEWLNLVPELLSYRDRINRDLDLLNAQKDSNVAEIGSYHVVYISILVQLKNDMIRMLTGSNEISETHTEESLRAEMQKVLEGSYEAKFLKPEKAKLWMEAVFDTYLDLVENNRISAPEISSVTLGDYYGVVDGEAHATITVPEEADVSTLVDPVIQSEGWVQANKQAGSVASGKLSYYLVPYEPTTGVTYDGIDQTSPITESGQGMGVDLGKTWTIQIRQGDPRLEVTDFSISLGETIFHGKIEGDTIRLLLPEGTDLTALKPRITHTAQSTSMDSRTIDFTRENSLTLTLENGTKTYTKTYTVEVTEGKSAESSLLTYQIAGVTGTPKEDGTLELTLPYGTDLNTAEASWTLSDGAVMQTEPAALSWNQTLIYVVQAENGESTSTYRIILKEQAAATESRILKFSYGSSVGVINEQEGTISLTVPAGTDLAHIKPKVEVSEFATVSPASGEEVNLSKAVRYTVTSQSGVTTTYKVTAQTNGPAENTYIPQMRRLLNNIVSRYKISASGDWEWIDYGMSAKLPDASSAADLPANFNLYEQMKGLDLKSYAMSVMARKIMTLTAMGVNAADLDAYGDGSTPFTIADGTEVHDLVEKLYNYDGSWTINHVAFALIALDMGNYTVPEDAYWTRERLLETLLDHVYGSDGFCIDQVGNIMYAIGPYQDDPVYGERVKAKLQEGLSIILGEKTAKSCEAMTDDYMFKCVGTLNSESASWVNMGLCSMGIDWHTDPRFTDGEKSALSQWLKFATNDGFKHTLSEIQNNTLATYEACYNLQWYLGFLDHGGAGHPYYLWYQVRDYATPLSTEAEILSFTVQGQQAEIDSENAVVTVKMPVDTPLENLTPEIQLSRKAKLKAPTLPVTFVEGVSQPFTIVAEDGVTTKTWNVKLVYDDRVVAAGTELKTESLSLTDKNQRAITILDQKVTETDEGTNILLTVSEGTDLTSIMLTAALDWKAVANVSVDGKEALDLSDWKEITVTAENGTTKTYRIKAQYERVAAITAFYLNIGGKTYAGAISGTTITVSGVPSNADVTRLAPEIRVNGDTTVVSPLSGVHQDFTNPVEYIVSGSKVKNKTYQVIVMKNGVATGDTDTEPDPTPTPTPNPDSGKDTDTDKGNQSSSEENKYKAERLWNEMEKEEYNTITDHQVVRD